MYITLNNRLVDKIICWFNNIKENNSYKRWNRKPHQAICVICGDKICSQQKQHSYSP